MHHSRLSMMTKDFSLTVSSKTFPRSLTSTASRNMAEIYLELLRKRIAAMMKSRVRAVNIHDIPESPWRGVCACSAGRSGASIMM